MKGENTKRDLGRHSRITEWTRIRLERARVLLPLLLVVVVVVVCVCVCVWGGGGGYSKPNIRPSEMVKMGVWILDTFWGTVKKLPQIKIHFLHVKKIYSVVKIET